VISDARTPLREQLPRALDAKVREVGVRWHADLRPEGAAEMELAACAGYTATDLNKFWVTRTVEQGAREPVRLALLDANGPTGTFSNEEGPLPW
jgi:hypothetical protein